MCDNNIYITLLPDGYIGNHQEVRLHHHLLVLAQFFSASVELDNRPINMTLSFFMSPTSIMSIVTILLAMINHVAQQ